MHPPFPSITSSVQFKIRITCFWIHDYRLCIAPLKRIQKQSQVAGWSFHAGPTAAPGDVLEPILARRVVDTLIGYSKVTSSD